MKLAWTLLPPVLLCGFLLVPEPGTAKPEYGRMTDRDCDYCHVPKTRKLTDAGNYYRQHRTLKGFKATKQ
jgi:hypothetical protein